MLEPDVISAASIMNTPLTEIHFVSNNQDMGLRCVPTPGLSVCPCLVSLQGKRNKPGVEAASSPDSVRGRGENKAIK